MEPKDARVLVVDDDVTLRGAMALVVRRGGYQVLDAGSGNAALRLLGVEAVDIVISDISMADGDGISLLKELRRRDPDVPVVILVTGYSDVQGAQAIADGARAVISKPFESRALIAALDQAIGYVRGK